MEPSEDPALLDTLERRQDSGADSGEPDTGVRLPAKYRFVETIGRGGMGAVVKAVDDTLGRTVAIKMLRTDVAPTDEARERLRREAKILSSLQHPNIASLYGLEELDGRQLLVMPFCEGETLQAKIDRRALSADDKRRILQELLAALQYAHEHGVIHRDIKPSNIIVTADGSIRVLDFGIAKSSSEDTLTTEGAILGTVVNMAPEQLRGGTLSPATDLWAVGTIAYELFEGKRPFDGGERMVTAMRILTEEPTPMTQTDAALRAWIARLLQKKPEERFASATETARALADPSIITSKAAPRRRSFTPIYVLAATGVAVGAWLTITSLSSPTSQPQPATQPSPIAAPTTPADPVAAPRDLRPVVRSPSASSETDAFRDATAAFEAGRYDEAALAFEHAYVLSGNSALLFNAAQAARLGGKRDLAKQIYQRALKSDLPSKTKREIQDALRKLEQVEESP